jgi:hypothetical protein
MDSKEKPDNAALNAAIEKFSKRYQVTFSEGAWQTAEAISKDLVWEDGSPVYETEVIALALGMLHAYVQAIKSSERTEFKLHTYGPILEKVITFTLPPGIRVKK